MADPYFLQSLGLSGFRAYLQPKTFDFSKKRCLAIFAPNGSGKSSVIDALEFMFSKDGTLERLGQRTINNQAGPVAMAHNCRRRRRSLRRSRLASFRARMPPTAADRRRGRSDRYRRWPRL